MVPVIRSGGPGDDVLQGTDLDKLLSEIRHHYGRDAHHQAVQHLTAEGRASQVPSPVNVSDTWPGSRNRSRGNADHQAWTIWILRKLRGGSIRLGDHMRS
jgi:hypothetical protein